jgi:hypothetical protein
MKTMLRVLLITFCCCLVSGCPPLQSTYLPTDRKQFVSGRSVIVGDFENHLGFSDPRRVRFNILWQRPVTDIVREAVGEELQKSGFVLGGKGLIVSGILHKITNGDLGTTEITFRIKNPLDQRMLYEQRIKSPILANSSIDFAGQMTSLHDCIDRFIDDARARIAFGTSPESSESLFTAGPQNLYQVPMVLSTVPPALTYPSNKLSHLTIPSTGAVQTWAVIIGISNYRDTRIPSLRYAVADAKAFYEWTISPSGGRYAPAQVKVLLNEEATGEKIKEALFEWLKQALAEDVITIYYSGHGTPDSPDSNDNLFLLPFDANYERIATTGFPMWDIETALKRFIKARKVVVIADACHSEGVGQSFDIARRSNRGIKVNSISDALQNLSKVGDGVCVISASDASQMSQESEEWGGGHGVFTHFLLLGLNGKADYNKDGKVTLGELIPYLSEQVRQATKNAQAPTISGKFDPALSIGR